MSEEYIGSIVLEVDGVGYDLTDFDAQQETGRKPIEAMTSDGLSPGFTAGPKKLELSFKVLVPINDPPRDWGGIKNGVVTMAPLNAQDKRTVWTGCYTTKVGMSAGAGQEFKLSVEMKARDSYVE